MSSSVLTGTIQLDASDVEFHYEDSGTAALKDPATYTTLVCIPGWSFNGSVFRSLFPCAGDSNYRIVGLYRRGYPPTTAWKETEPNPLDKDQQEEFLKQEALQLAGFLTKFATSQAIPKINEEQKTGGIVVLGWSLGASYLHSLLAYLDVLPADQLKDLETYLYAVVSHDTNLSAHGLPDPIAGDFGSQLDPVERFEYFMTLVTGYYTHPNVQSHNLDDLEFTPTPNLGASHDDLGGQEYVGMTSIDMFTGPDLSRILIGRELLEALTRRALFDVTLAQKLPRVRVRYICGGQTMGNLIHAMHKLEEAWNGDPSQLFGEGATKARDARFTYLEWGNHFSFRDDPRRALQNYKTCVEQD
ncbi:hypothetical protein PAXINDRAFT_172940 [Paxillus involutus ATCC 200175]|uniref:AB hydrolase-1 domain-containing protein n=1 Tax=Paxillus involutus ATCC 200175 TaxID=664439 RepID=A0A0C9SNS7_PAXIN|nr:hypothetical protein PAXINDRAFT_172940 [Paxillus involutus ATCC 200175]